MIILYKSPIDNHSPNPYNKDNRTSRANTEYIIIGGYAAGLLLSFSIALM